MSRSKLQKAAELLMERMDETGQEQLAKEQRLISALSSPTSNAPQPASTSSAPAR